MFVDNGGFCVIRYLMGIEYCVVFMSPLWGFACGGGFSIMMSPRWGYYDVAPLELL